MAPSAVPVTVFTGFVGAGKTTIILDILRRLRASSVAATAAEAPPRIAILKNEFGDVAVDSMLARESALGVKEMLNGCLCCVLVGQLKDALQELKGAPLYCEKQKKKTTLLLVVVRASAIFRILIIY